MFVLKPLFWLALAAQLMLLAIMYLFWAGTPQPAAGDPIQMIGLTLWLTIALTLYLAARRLASVRMAAMLMVFAPVAYVAVQYAIWTVAPPELTVTRFGPDGLPIEKGR